MDGNEEKLVSVIMGIYNCQDTLAEALESIICQTYPRWEIIMCDDGSGDNTLRVAKDYAERYPDRIRLLTNRQNMGLNVTLNRCLGESAGEYIARMDGDDTCSADRFEKEIAVLNSDLTVAIVSTDMSFFDETGVWGRTNKEAAPTKESFMFKTPFCHAPCMVRKEAYLAVEGYSVDKKLLRVEDYHLWVKMYAKGYRGVNIPECLYQMRDDRNAIRRRKFRYRLNEAYVKACAIKMLKLPIRSYIYCAKPILVGLLPTPIYKMLHRKHLGE